MCVVFQYASNIRFWVPIGCLRLVVEGSTRVAWSRRGGQGRAGGENICAGEQVKLFWIVIYCNNPRPNPGSQSGSWSCWVLEIWAPQIMRECYLATVSTIQPLTQTGTCEMGSSNSSAISWLKFVSTMRVYFPSMPYTERTNGEKKSVICGIAYRVIFIFLLPLIQELYHGYFL